MLARLFNWLKDLFSSHVLSPVPICHFSSSNFDRVVLNKTWVSVVIDHALLTECQTIINKVDRDHLNQNGDYKRQLALNARHGFKLPTGSPMKNAGLSGDIGANMLYAYEGGTPRG
ncbi:MAG: hypothetical protein ACRD5H_04085 [Nitrososphaerales archaeon]